MVKYVKVEADGTVASAITFVHTAIADRISVMQCRRLEQLGQSRTYIFEVTITVVGQAEV